MSDHDTINPEPKDAVAHDCSLLSPQKDPMIRFMIPFILKTILHPTADRTFVHIDIIANDDYASLSANVEKCINISFVITTDVINSLRPTDSCHVTP